MDKPGATPTLSDGFRLVDELLRSNVEAQFRELQRTSCSEQERSLLDLENRVLANVSSQVMTLRQELRDHVDEQHRIAVARQVEFEDTLLRSSQDRASQLHRSWTSEQELSMRKLSDDVRQMLLQSMEQRLQQLSTQLTALEAKISVGGGERAALSQELCELRDQFQLTSSGAASGIAVVPTANSVIAQCVHADGRATAPEAKNATLDQVLEAPEVNDRTLLPNIAHHGLPADALQLAPQSETVVALKAEVREEFEVDEEMRSMSAVRNSDHAVSCDGKVDAFGSNGLSPPLSPSAADEMEDCQLTRRPSENLEDIDATNSDMLVRTKPRRNFWLRRRVLSFIAIFLLGAVIAIFWKPFLTVTVILIVLMWSLFLCGEEPIIRMVSNRAYGAQPDWCKRKVCTTVTFLRAIQNLRSTHEKEQDILIILYTASILLFILCPDSTSISLWLFQRFGTTIALVVLVLAAIALALVVRGLVSYVHQPQTRRRLYGASEYSAGSAAAKKQLEEIKSWLQATAGSRRRNSENKIKEIFSESEEDLLNELLAEMSHAKAVCSLANVILFFNDEPGNKARTDFLMILCEQRCDELTVRSKSTVLDALLMMKLSSCEYGETAVANLITSSLGDELSELKSIQDSGNVHSIHKLVYEDVTNSRIRDQLVDHFLAESVAQVAHRTLKANPHFVKILEKSRRRGCMPDHFHFLEAGDAEGEREYHGRRCGHAWLKIFTDIDDTLECSGGRWPAGIDARYPRHTPYPGVTAFYKELQGGGTVGQLVALSARPHFVGTVVEERLMAKFAHLKSDYGLHCIPALLTGAMDAGAKFLVSGGDEDGLSALGTKKFEKFQEFLRLYPEFRLIFIGDNGQADYAVGQMICKRFPQHVEQVWIHEVQPREKTFRYDPKSTDNLPIHFVQNFIDAATQAATRPVPLVTPQGLHRVVVAAIADFRRVQTWPSEEIRLREADQLNRSIKEACQVLSIKGVCSDDIESLEDGKKSSEFQKKTADPQTPPVTPKACPNQEASRASSWTLGWQRAPKKERAPKQTSGDGKHSPKTSPMGSPHHPAHSPNITHVPPEVVEPPIEVAPQLPEQPDASDGGGEHQSKRQMLLQWVRGPQPNESNAAAESATPAPVPTVENTQHEGSAAMQPVIDEPDAEPSDVPATSGSIMSRALGHLARSVTTQLPSRSSPNMGPSPNPNIVPSLTDSSDAVMESECALDHQDGGQDSFVSVSQADGAIERCWTARSLSEASPAEVSLSEVVATASAQNVGGAQGAATANSHSTDLATELPPTGGAAGNTCSTKRSILEFARAAAGKLGRAPADAAGKLLENLEAAPQDKGRVLNNASSFMSLCELDPASGEEFARLPDEQGFANGGEVATNPPVSMPFSTQTSPELAPTETSTGGQSSGSEMPNSNDDAVATSSPDTVENHSPPISQLAACEDMFADVAPSPSALDMHGSHATEGLLTATDVGMAQAEHLAGSSADIPGETVKPSSIISRALDLARGTAISKRMAAPPSEQGSAAVDDNSTLATSYEASAFDASQQISLCASTLVEDGEVQGSPREAESAAQHVSTKRSLLSFMRRDRTSSPTAPIKEIKESAVECPASDVHVGGQQSDPEMTIQITTVTDQGDVVHGGSFDSIISLSEEARATSKSCDSARTRRPSQSEADDVLNTTASSPLVANTNELQLSSSGVFQGHDHKSDESDQLVEAAESAAKTKEGAVSE